MSSFTMPSSCVLVLLIGSDQTLHYGNKSQKLISTPESVTHELYRPSNHDGVDGLILTGVVSHKLEARKAEEVMAGADAALLALQSNLAAIDKEKQSKK